MNTFTVPSAGRTSAYPSRYRGHWLLAPRFAYPLATCGWLPAHALTSHESRQQVIPFRVSIFRDRRVVLYAGFRLGECHAPMCRMTWNQSHFGPATQPLGRVSVTTPHPHLYSSLPVVTCSTGRFVRLDAYRLSALLLTMDHQSHARGQCCLPFTGKVRVDDYPSWEYHLTHMDTQLSKITRPLPLSPHALRHGFERTGRTHCMKPTRHARRTRWLPAC